MATIPLGSGDKYVDDQPEKDVLFKFLDYEIKRMEFFDSQRERMTALLFAVATGLLAVSAVEKHLNWIDFVMGILLFTLGVYGAIFSAKHYLRSREHRYRSRVFEDRLDELYGAKQMITLREYGKGQYRDMESRRRWARMIDTSDKISLYWSVLPIGISIVGLVLLGFSCYELSRTKPGIPTAYLTDQAGDATENQT